MHKRSMLSVLMGIATVLLLSSCTQVPKTLEIFTEPVEKPKLELPSVDRFSQRPINWIVVTPENAQSVFEKLKNENKQIVVFAVDEKGYEALSLNVTDLLKLVKQQKAVIHAYETYYENEE